MFLRILTSSLFLIFASGGTAYALNADTSIFSQETFGSCTFRLINGGTGANVSLYKPGDFSNSTGGSYWNNVGSNSWENDDEPDIITRAQIAECAGNGAIAGDVNITSNQGAVGNAGVTSYSDQSFMGIKFTLFGKNYEFSLNDAYPAATRTAITNPSIRQRPTAEIGALSDQTAGKFTATITLSASSPDFTADDLTLENATATISGSGDTYTATITPAAEGSFSIQVKAESFQNAYGKTNPATSNKQTGEFDNTPPTVTISDISERPDTSGNYTATVTLSETSDDFAVEDLTLENASATMSGSGTSYTLTLTPTSTNVISVQVNAESFTDPAANKNTAASNKPTREQDTTPPTATIGEISNPDDAGNYTAIITTSEEVTGLTADDLIVENATATLTGSGTSYTVTLTPTNLNTLSVQVKANSFKDLSHNENTEASNKPTKEQDVIPPEVVISGMPDSYAYGETFTVTVTFNEPIKEFEESDITVENASISDFKAGDADNSYTMTVTPTYSGNVTLQVAAGVTEDLAGNPNNASNTVEVKNTTVEQTQKVIAEFLINRASALLANQPDLTNLLSGNGSGSFSGGGNDDGGNLDFNSDPNKPVWLRVSASWSKNGDTKSNYVFGAAGIHYKFSPNFLAGVMVEFDQMNSESKDSNIEGTGWLVGPYAVAKLPNHPLYFDARLLWGKSKNEVSPFGTYTDEFDTERLLARIKISGDLIYGGFTITPNAVAAYTTDKQESYTDSLGNVIPSQTVELGEVSAGLDFSVPIELETGRLTLKAGIDGIYSHKSISGAIGGASQTSDNYRARVDFGIDYNINQAVSLDFNVFYDGIGAKDQETYGLDAGIKIKF